MDRSDLIKALGESFAADKKNQQDSDRLTIETANAGERVIHRVSNIRENNPMFELQRTNPEAYVIIEVAEKLIASKERSAVATGNKFKEKLEAAANDRNVAAVDSLIFAAKEINKKLLVTREGTPQRAIVYMYAQDTINRM